jgi:hypothetical protein
MALNDQERIEIAREYWVRMRRGFDGVRIVSGKIVDL